MKAADIVFSKPVIAVFGVACARVNLDDWIVGREVNVFLIDSVNRLCVRIGDEVIELEHEEVGAANFRELCQQNQPRIAVISDVREADDLLVVAIAVRTFGRSLSIGDVSLVVDSKVIDDIRRISRRSLNQDAAIRWLADQLFIPPIQDGDTQRFLLEARSATPEGEDARVAFTILGERVRADVRRVAGVGQSAGPADTLRVDRVVALGGRKGRFGEVLVEGRIRLVDELAAVCAPATLRAQIASLDQNESSFMALWNRYQLMELELLKERVNEIGVRRYLSCDDLGESRYRLELAPISDEVRSSTLAKDDTLRLTAVLPTVEEIIGKIDALVRENAPADDDPSPQKRGEKSQTDLEVTIKEIDAGGRTLIVQSFKDGVPPAQGYICAGIGGDHVVHDRRRKARRRIQNGESGMPQLALILDEVGPLVTPRVRRARPVTGKVIAKVFTTETGEVWQPTLKQREAINAAINTPDIAIIQGPPGTGKTTVMRAIIERLHEMNAENPDRAAKFLVTGFQHDAVENAIEKMKVNGLPAMKIGRRSGEPKRSQEEEQDLILDEFISTIRSGRVSREVIELKQSNLRFIEAELNAYVASPRSAESCVELLDAVRAKLGADLPGALVDQLRLLSAEISQLSLATRESESRARQVRAARAIRISPTSFADDGAQTARTALSRFQGLGFEVDISVLERAANWFDAETPPFLYELARLRSLVLGRLCQRGDAFGSTGVNEDVVNALEAVRDHCRKSFEQSASATDLAISRFDVGLDDRAALADAVCYYTAVIAATCQQAVSGNIVHYVRGTDDALIYDSVLCDEAARANPLDLMVPLACAGRRIVLVGDHRQLPHIVEDAIERRLLDEHHGPLEEGTTLKSVEEEFRTAMRESLFERLFKVLQERELKDKHPRTVTLDEQHRMHPVLGGFVSTTFYPPAEQFRSPRTADQFAHSLPGFAGRCAAWLDVPAVRGGEDQPRQQTSWQRPAEAKAIASALRAMLESTDPMVLKMKFGVITYYKAQVSAVERELVREGIMDQHGAEAPSLVQRFVGRLRVGTVDAFQGREFDAVFLSIVRCNVHRGSDERMLRKRFGHLMSINRMCVSMSRQQRLLIVVGDSAMTTQEGAAAAIPALVKFRQLAEQDERTATGRAS